MRGPCDLDRREGGMGLQVSGHAVRVTWLSRQVARQIMGKPRYWQGPAGVWSSRLRPGCMGSMHQGDGGSRHCLGAQGRVGFAVGSARQTIIHEKKAMHT